ncbi:hypothetical protein HY933_04035 [Candidatus Falkowbacteria bacterium]|nr:hypothetical protein [Candidatus Falkowbacteria bacterium]
MDIIFRAIGVLGLISIIFGVLAKQEQRQHLLFIVGGALLLTYSIYLGDVIFMALQSFFTGAAVFKLLQLAGQPSLWERFKHLFHK